MEAGDQLRTDKMGWGLKGRSSGELFKNPAQHTKFNSSLHATSVVLGWVTPQGGWLGLVRRVAGADSLQLVPGM
jgi:hypothetical protein